MLILNLESDKPCFKRGSLGPVDGMRIVGRSIQVLPHKFEILRLIGEQWRDVTGETYDSVIIDANVLIYGQLRCGDRGTSYGPFDHMRLSGATLQTSADGLHSFARLNTPGNGWVVEWDQTSWRSLVVSTAFQ